MGLRTFHLAVNGQVLAASLSWPTAGFSILAAAPPAPPVDFFSPAALDLHFAASQYREGVGGTVHTSPASITDWTYSRTGTRTAAYVNGSTADFTANVPAITDKGILVAGADGSSGADVMPVIDVAALAGSATVFVEWYDTTPSASEVLFCLDGNAPGCFTQGIERPNGSVRDDTAGFTAINRAAISYDASVFSGVVNGAQPTAVDDASTWWGAVTGKTGVAIGRFHTATSGQPNAYIRRIAVFPSKISTQGLRVLTTLPDRVIALVGDSITKGDGVDEFGPLVAASFAGETVFAPNYGVSGSSWVYDWPSDAHVGTMTADAPTIGGLLDVPVTNGSWMVAFAGTNGIVLKSNSAAQEYADFETWLAATLAEGWEVNRIVVCTMLPRTGVSEATRSAYNAALVAGAATHGYRLARFDLDAEMGGAGDDLNTTYFSDGTHPTTAGHARLAPIVYAALTS